MKLKKASFYINLIAGKGETKDEAIRELSTDGINFSTHSSYGWYYVECYPTRSYSDCQHLLSVYAANCKEEHIDNDDPRVVFNGKKRIMGGKMYQALNARRKAMLKDAETLEKTAEELDVTLGRIEQTKELLMSLVRSMPSHAINVCGLDKMRYL